MKSSPITGKLSVRKNAEKPLLKGRSESRQFVCFYCHGPLKEGTGRRFKTTEDGLVWEVHSRHAVLPTEIPFKEEQE